MRFSLDRLVFFSLNRSSISLSLCPTPGPHGSDKRANNSGSPERNGAAASHVAPRVIDMRSQQTESQFPTSPQVIANDLLLAQSPSQIELVSRLPQLKSPSVPVASRVIDLRSDTVGCVYVLCKCVCVCVFVCVCVCVCKYICIYIYIYIYTYMYVYLYIYLSLCVCMYLSMCICR